VRTKIERPRDSRSVDESKSLLRLSSVNGPSFRVSSAEGHGHSVRLSSEGHATPASVQVSKLRDMRIEDHPTVRRLAREARPKAAPEKAEGATLRRIALERGADDVGLVEIGRPALEPQREEILGNYPWTRSLLSFVVGMAREPVRGAPRIGLDGPFRSCTGNRKRRGLWARSLEAWRSRDPRSQPGSRSSWANRLCTTSPGYASIRQRLGSVPPMTR
jgi:hypothetical protein